jgi:hypothetical protein
MLSVRPPQAPVPSAHDDLPGRVPLSATLTFDQIKFIIPNGP